MRIEATLANIEAPETIIALAIIASGMVVLAWLIREIEKTSRARGKVEI